MLSKNPGRVVFVLVIVALASLGGCFMLFTTGSKAVVGATASADTFLKYLEAGNHSAAEDMISDEVSRTKSAQALEKILTHLQERHGKMTGHTGPNSVKIRTVDGSPHIDLLYMEKFERGETFVSFIFVKEKEQWKINACKFGQ